jgi:hypothetical protein
MDDRNNLKNLKIFNDNAIDDATFFNFDSYVKSLKKIILHSDNSTPFSISINGKWGTGKTSLMKTLRRELNSHQTPDPSERKVHTVWFNAWKYSNTDNLLAALASEIYQEMIIPPSNVKKGFWNRIKGGSFFVSENADVPQQILDLTRIVTLGKTPDFRKWRRTPEYKKYLPYYTHFQQFLNRVLSYFVLSDLVTEYDDKKGVLVIFIDDLDRCPPKDITTILESVNLFFDQNGCIFVFGMDLALISEAVEKQYAEYPCFSGKTYIEKLIQLQFNLPELRDDRIKAFFEKEIADDEPLHEYLDLIITCSGRNPRKVKQFINSLRLMMTLASSIDSLHVEEELLIKWTLLHFVSSRFVNEIKKNSALLVFVQWYIKIDHPDEQEFSIYSFELESYDEKFKKLVDDFKNDPKIIEILHDGSHEFSSDNLDNYIYLSSMAPEVPQFIIEANKDSFILGSSITFSGSCIDGGNKVHLVIFGPGEFSNGIEIATPQVSIQNRWIFIWTPDKNAIPGSYVAHVFTDEKRNYGILEFKIHKGAVTVVTAGSQSYYIGDKIRFSGTCNASSTVFLSFFFPGSKVQRKFDQSSIESINGDENTFLKLDVKSDHTWSYEWDTTTMAPVKGEGIFIILACEGPFLRDYMKDKAYGTVSIILKNQS